MDGIVEFFTTWREFFTDKELAIPAIQMVYYVGLINVLMLLGRDKLAFLVSLVCSLYWMFCLNQEKFVSPDGDFVVAGVLTMLGACVLLVIALYAFLTQNSD